MDDEAHAQQENLLAQGKVICGVTRIGPTGIEWICVDPPHDTVYQRRGKATPYPGGPRGGKADRHWFVNRWPNRPPQT